MSYLQHHGILGMKWGVRRYQNKDGSRTAAGKKKYAKRPNPETYDVVKKGSPIYRIGNNPDDPTYDNKKYVSLNAQDHSKWQEYIGDHYNKTGQAYNIMYVSTGDLKIAKYTEVGKLFMKKLNDNDVKNQMINDTLYSSKSLGYKSEDANDMLSLNFTMQTKTGKEFVKELMNMGYQGVQDRHGQNTSENPVIIFDPDKNLKKSGFSLYKPKTIR